MADTVERSPYSSDPVTEFVQTVESRLPGLRGNVPPKLDMLGRPVPNDDAGLGSLSPPRYSLERDDPIVNELGRLDVSVPLAPKTDSLPRGTGQVSIDLTEAEQRTFQALRGQALIGLVQQQLETDAYQGFTDARKANWLGNLVDLARDRAVTALARQMGGEEVRRRQDATGRRRAAALAR